MQFINILSKKGTKLCDYVHKTKSPKKHFPGPKKRKKKTSLLFFSLQMELIENTEMSMRNKWCKVFMRLDCDNWFCNSMQFTMRSNLRDQCTVILVHVCVCVLFWQMKRGWFTSHYECVCSIYDRSFFFSLSLQAINIQINGIAFRFLRIALSTQ